MQTWRILYPQSGHQVACSQEIMRIYNVYISFSSWQIYTRLWLGNHALLLDFNALTCFVRDFRDLPSSSSWITQPSFLLSQPCQNFFGLCSSITNTALVLVRIKMSVFPFRFLICSLIYFGIHSSAESFCVMRSNMSKWTVSSWWRRRQP